MDELSRVSLSEARQAIEDERRIRQERCRARLQQVLEEEGCALEPRIVLGTTGVVSADVAIIVGDARSA